jgi:hypothetical protein
MLPRNEPAIFTADKVFLHVLLNVQGTCMQSFTSRIVYLNCLHNHRTPL